MKTRRSKKSDPKKDEKDALIAAMRVAFDKEMSTIEKGEDFLFQKLLLAGSIKCKKCLSTDFIRTDGTRQVCCKSCRHKQSFTSGTFFNRMRRETTLEYLFLISLLENGIIVNASEFERHSSVCYSTSLSMIKKSGFVIEKFMSKENLDKLHCSELKTVVQRRSRETPARRHPRDEQRPAVGADVIEPKTVNKEIPNSVTGEIFSISLLEEHATLFEELTTEQQQIFCLMTEDSLAFDHLLDRSNQPLQQFNANLIQIEMAGFLYGQGAYVHKNKAVIPTPTAIGADIDPSLKQSAKVFIAEEYQGVSQKALQLYLGLHWYHTDQEFWTKGRLFNAFLTSQPVTNKQILSYVSPQVLSVAHPQNVQALQN